MLNSISNPKNLFLLLIALTVLFIFLANSAYAAWPEVEKLLADDGADYDWFGRSVSISGDYAIVGANRDDDSGNASGSAYIFYYDGTNWSQQAKLIASDGAVGDYFGFSVSISGDYAIVGASGDDSAYIFKRSGTSWSEQAKLTPYGGYFGCSVSISGDYAIVGADWDDGESGSAYIFKRSGTNWSEQAKLKASDTFGGQHFGNSVSISGAYTIVGAYDDNGPTGIDPGMGAAYIFTPNDVDPNNWDQVTKLTAPEGAMFDFFGSSVSISGDFAIISSPQDDDKGTESGSAYIFKRDGTNWSMLTKLHAADGAAYDYFGDSVSISGDYAVVGAYANDDNGSNSGSAYIFYYNGTNWFQQAKLLAADGAAGDEFGRSVSISGACAIVGASYGDGNEVDSGSAYIYIGSAIHGTKWHDKTDEEPIEGWLIYIDVNENGQFDAGEPNDITDAYGNYVLTVPAAGTWLVAEEARPCWEQTYPGGDGTYSVTLGIAEIAAGYNFGNARPTEIYPSGWGQQKLTAADAAANDRFGRSVSISGDYAIVGSYRDASGSAYIFAPNDVNCTDWDQAAKLTASDGAFEDLFGGSVSISGDYAIVGAYWDDDSGSASGSAYIFYFDGTNWNQQAKLTAADGAAVDWFGYSVSISGDYAIVGAYYDDDNGSDSGSAYIFYYDGTNWSQQTKLLASDGAADDRFGHSVSISGDYAIVGAFYDDDNGTNSGSAYIFTPNDVDPNNWDQVAKLLASDGAAYDNFGKSVSISGDYAIVGAEGDDDSGNGAGSAYIFKRSGTNWSQQAKLLASDGASLDWFGISVSISGDYVVVGAYGDDDSGSNSGSAYIFKRSGTTWSEQFKWLAADGAADDYFGYSVSVSGDYAVVGAYADDDSGSMSGSAYIFGKVLCPIADLTGDCFVNFKDIAVIADEWLQGVE